MKRKRRRRGTPRDLPHALLDFLQKMSLFQFVNKRKCSVNRFLDCLLLPAPNSLIMDSQVLDANFKRLDVTLPCHEFDMVAPNVLAKIGLTTLYLHTLFVVVFHKG